MLHIASEHFEYNASHVYDNFMVLWMATDAFKLQKWHIVSASKWVPSTAYRISYCVPQKKVSWTGLEWVDDIFIHGWNFSCWHEMQIHPIYFANACY